MSFSQLELDSLFPLPLQSAYTLPGTSAESAEALVRLLKEDFVKFHCFFNEKRFHNHLSHHLYAAYALGATPKILQEAYDYHASYQIKAYPSPGPISVDNWKDHLGDEAYYQAYLKFFVNELREHGTASTLEKFIFSPDANFGQKHPEMVSRILAGLLHPEIYVGYGIEFGHLGMVAAGLAQTAVHRVTTSDLITEDFLNASRSPSLVTALEQKLTLHANGSPSNVHTLSILDRVLKDQRLNPKKPSGDLERYFDNCVKELGSVIKEYALTWQADTSTSAATDSSLEELVWSISVVYGIGGFRKNRPFKADFFAMHFITASHFLSPILNLVNKDSKRILLRAYFASFLGFWISQGRTPLNIEGFYDATANLKPPGPVPTPHKETFTQENLYPNLWYPIAQSVLLHPGEHVLKLVRAFARYATLYGITPKGHFKDVELKGVELLDGSLFVRTSFLSLERNGWMREGGDKAFWDFDGFFDDN